MFARWLAALPVAVLALGQTAPEPASVAGTVSNSITGEPILRAHLSIRCNAPDHPQGQQAYGALSNAKGEFSIAPLPGGDCWLTAQRVGFLQTGTNFSLKSGIHKEDLKLKLTPTGAITGRVLDAAGEPVQGANVAAELASGNSQNTSTDDKGQFRIGGLSPGKYRVKASRRSLPLPPEVRADGAAEMRDAATYYPDSLSAQMAQRVEVKPGIEASGIEIRMVQTPVVKVSGKVTGIPAGMKDVTLNVMPSGLGSAIKADGTFVLWQLDPGTYTLRAQHWGQSPVMSAPLDIEVATTNVENLELHMVPPFEIAGQLRFEDDQAREQPKPATRPNGTVGRNPPPQSRNVRLSPAGRQYNAGDSTAALGDDDTFAVEKVQPARYRLTVSGVSGYVKSVRAGDTETDGDILDVRNGSRGPVTITLSSNYCELSGTVGDSNGPAVDATVVLARADDLTRVAIARSDSTGAYKFRIAPGKYRLAVVDKDAMGLGWEESDPDYYQPDEIELNAGDKISRNVVQGK